MVIDITPRAYGVKFILMHSLCEGLVHLQDSQQSFLHHLVPEYYIYLLDLLFYIKRYLYTAQLLLDALTLLAGLVRHCQV